MAALCCLLVFLLLLAASSSSPFSAWSRQRQRRRLQRLHQHHLRLKLISTEERRRLPCDQHHYDHHCTRLAVILLVYDSIDFAAQWKSWARLASPGHALSFYVHCKNLPEHEDVPGAKEIGGARRVPTVGSAYLYLGSMICGTVRHVLENDGDGIQGCVFASGACVPVQHPDDLMRQCQLSHSALAFFDDDMLAAAQWCYLTKQFMLTLAYQVGACPEKHSVRLREREYIWGPGQCQEEHLLVAVAREFALPVCRRITTYVIWRRADIPLGYDMRARSGSRPCEFTKIDPVLLKHLSSHTCFFRKVFCTPETQAVVDDHLVWLKRQGGSSGDRAAAIRDELTQDQTTLLNTASWI